MHLRRPSACGKFQYRCGCCISVHFARTRSGGLYLEVERNGCAASAVQLGGLANEVECTLPLTAPNVELGQHIAVSEIRGQLMLLQVLLQCLYCLVGPLHAVVQVRQDLGRFAIPGLVS